MNGMKFSTNGNNAPFVPFLSPFAPFGTHKTRNVIYSRQKMCILKNFSILVNLSVLSYDIRRIMSC